MISNIATIICDTSFSEITDATEKASQTRDRVLSFESILDKINTLFSGAKNLWTVLLFIIIAISAIRWLVGYRRKINSISNEKINELNNNKKYIPGLFVELNESKEYLRYFFYRRKWKHRIINEFNAIFNDHYGDLLKEAFGKEICFKINRFVKISTLISQMENTNHFINDLYGRNVEFPEQYKDSLVIFHIFSNKYKHLLDELINKANLIKTKYYIITGSAGNGKTNLLCNFAEMIITSKKKCIFLNGKDVSSDIYDYYLKQIGIPKWSFENKKLLYLFTALAKIRMNLNFHSTYIIIDAVNENNDTDFLVNLPQFINKLLSYHKTYVVLSCRSEYYQIRYKSILTDKVHIQPIVNDIVQGEYSKEALNRLFAVYADVFAYHVELNYFVKERLSKQLLLTRIFYETYGGTDAYISDLNVYKLYEQYISHISINKNVNAEKLLLEVAEIMIKKKDYSSVAFSEISEDSKGIYSKIDGSVLVSKAVVNRPNSITAQEEERIYFIFDEMRDYCISRCKMLSLCNKDELPKEKDLYDFILLLKQEKATCLEGVINYIYREGQIQKWNELCRRILNNEIKPNDKLENRSYKIHNELCWGLRLVFDNPDPFLKCENDYIFEIMDSCNNSLVAQLLNLLILQEIYCGKYNLDIYLDKLHQVKDIGDTLNSSFDAWLYNSVKIIQLQNIDEKLNNSHNTPSLTRFRKLEVLCLIFLSWNNHDELQEYLRETIPDYNNFVKAVIEEYITGGNNDYCN